jgi:hypothetical protein
MVTLPCGHSFGVLNWLRWCVASTLQCPLCRDGVQTELVSVACIPNHLVVPLLTVTRESRPDAPDGTTEDDDDSSEDRSIMRALDTSADAAAQSDLMDHVTVSLTEPWDLHDVRLCFTGLRGPNFEDATADAPKVYAMWFMRPMEPSLERTMWLVLQDESMKHLADFVKRQIVEYNEGIAFYRSQLVANSQTRAGRMRNEQFKADVEKGRMRYARIEVCARLGSRDDECVMCDSGVVDLESMNTWGVNTYSDAMDEYTICVRRDDLYPNGINNLCVGLKTEFFRTLDHMHQFDFHRISEDRVLIV